LETIINFIGHFHPVLVHLPIGILLFAIVLQLLSKWEKFNQLTNALHLAYLLGAISAVFSCFTGLALANNGDYDADLVFKHQWLGISVAVISLTGYYLIKKNKTVYSKWLSYLLLLLIILTGHLGGTLTHGEGYLTIDVAKEEGGLIKNDKPIITNAQEALVYKDIIQPILKDKCYGCHSAIKQKGKLRLDEKEWILKGGEDGIIIHAGEAMSSTIYKNILLDPVDEQHMPPKGKPQITDQERMLLEWWINTGASFDKKVKELPQNNSIPNILLALQNNKVNKVEIPSIPEKEVAPADEKAINALKNKGVTIVNVALNSNYLNANFITLSHTSDTIHDLIGDIKENLVWIKMPGMQFTDALSEAIADCSSLTKLSINNTNITDFQLSKLNSLNELQYLNIVNTKVTLAGLLKLTNLKKLTQLYLGQTSITADDLNKIKNVFPNAKIDFGNYQIEKLITDTQLVKAPERK
jgi:uncharacterized membrane protein